MGLRPVTTHWFQMLCPQEEVTRATLALARTGHVQIESEDDQDAPVMPELHARLEAFDALERRYGDFWPASAADDCGCVGNPVSVLDRNFAALEAWASDARTLIERVQASELELAELALLKELADAGGEDLPDLSRFAADHSLLSAELLVLPHGAPEPALPQGVVRMRTKGTDHTMLLVVGSDRAKGAIEAATEAARARRVALPRWLPSTSDAARVAIEARTRDASAKLEAARAELDALSERHHVARAVSAIRGLDWYVRFVRPSRQTRNFTLVTGFSDVPREELQGAVDAEGLHALVTMCKPPPGHVPPTVLRNAWWVRPFEVFARLVGVPAEGEVDPSALLSVIAPLLFGYMFGDVGHGFVLLVAGLALRHRIPSVALLIPGGISAMVFGALFGSVFTLETVFPAVWIHPMQEPLTLLGASVAAGAAIMIVGLGLGALGAVYRGELGRFLRTEAAIIAIYVGLVGMLLDVRAGYVSLAAVLWFFVGHLSVRPHRLGHALAEIGELVERLVQLGVNTVSFARVGAFALAHAGLAAAVAGMAEGAGAVGAAIILVVGNALIIIVEGLVASIQTTRLVLFEFFARFLEAKGRAFIPLLPPPATRARP